MCAWKRRPRREALAYCVAVTAATTLEVLDGFFALHGGTDFNKVPGYVLHEFGETVRAAAQDAASGVRPDRHPIYIGGWPSANFGLVHGDLIFSSLLYNQQLLIRDPIADWFSDEQYLVEHALAARPGYWNVGEGRVNTRETRQFLNVVAPAIRSLRPLIEAGIVVLVPSASVIYRRQRSIREIVDRMSTTPELAPSSYSSAFMPADIPVEDNVRGMFVFAPGSDPDVQIAAALRRGLTYFAREFVLAEEYGATYAAAFDHELFLCRNGARTLVRPSTRVSEALLQSRLPIFAGLTPALIANIHDDDSFATFRQELHVLLQNAPAGGTEAELAAYVEDQERTVLQPSLDAAAKSADRGLLRKIGAGLRRGSFGIAAGLVVDVAAGTGGVATGLNVARGVIEGFLDRKQPGSQRIWTSLIRHRAQVGEEIQGIEPRAGNNGYAWVIPTRPAMSVTVTAGSIIADFMARDSVEIEPTGGYQAGAYRPCPCGSGRKYKFCCEAADRRGPKFTAFGATGRR